MSLKQKGVVVKKGKRINKAVRNARYLLLSEGLNIHEAVKELKDNMDLTHEESVSLRNHLIRIKLLDPETLGVIYD